MRRRRVKNVRKLPGRLSGCGLQQLAPQGQTPESQNGENENKAADHTHPRLDGEARRRMAAQDILQNQGVDQEKQQQEDTPNQGIHPPGDGNKHHLLQSQCKL